MWYLETADGLLVSHLINKYRRASRWLLNDYGRFNSVSSILNQLSWPTLQSRCKLPRYVT